MNRSPVQVTLRSTPRRTEFQLLLSWRGRLSGPAVARLIAVLVLALTVMNTGHDHYARNLPGPSPAASCWRHAHPADP